MQALLVAVLVLLLSQAAGKKKLKPAGPLMPVATAVQVVLKAYPHANPDYAAQLLQIANVLPLVAAADAPTRASYKAQFPAYMDSIGATWGDPLAAAVTNAFMAACDGTSPGGNYRILNDLAWIVRRAGPLVSFDVEQVKYAALRAALQRAVGA